MTKFKLMTVVGTRPEIIRLAETIKKFDSISSVQQIFVHTGQNYDYELNEIFFNDLSLRKPDYFLDAVGKTAIETIGQIQIKIENVLDTEKPDAFLVLGDTNSCLCAIPAKRKKVPVFHMEAGNRCFDQRVPEEINRKIIDHISDINIAYSEIAKTNLLNEGLPIDRVFKVGSPMKEVLNKHSANIEASDVLTRLNLSFNNYFVVSAHRDENIESDNFYKLIDVLNSLSDKFEIPIIVSTHPRTRNRIDRENITLKKNIQLLKPLGFFDYLKLQINSFVTLSDSGTISEESTILNFPALNIRETHERQEATEEGGVIMVGMDLDRILQSLEVLKYQERGKNRTINIPKDYNIDNISDKIVRIVLSYTNYINRTIWSK